MSAGRALGTAAGTTGVPAGADDGWRMSDELAALVARRREEDRLAHVPYIAAALAAEGGHLAVGPRGGTLHFRRGASLSGFVAEEMAAQCEAAGLCVLDASAVPFAVAWGLIASGPMIAVGEPADPPPWGTYASAPLGVVADAYRRAGARVANAPPAPPGAPPLDLARFGVPEVAAAPDPAVPDPAPGPAAPSTPDGSTDP